MMPDLYIGNDCCGGNFYQQKRMQYNNPFIWMIVPYDSLIHLMQRFTEIDWFKNKIRPSTLRKNTFILTIDNLVEIHYIHHEYRGDCAVPTMREDHWGHHLGSNNIWVHIYNKYIERVNRMLSGSMQPNFIIHDQEWGNTVSIDAVIKAPCQFKRCFVTTSQCKPCKGDTNAKIIHVSQRTLPEPMIKTYWRKIDAFFNCEKS